MSAQTTVLSGGPDLAADLHIPAGARGLVVFAHGSGSSRRSPRNIEVARTLHYAGLGTLLFDLLTAAEERRDSVDASLRFDIPFLTERLTAVVDEVRSRKDTAALPVGLFGASTGAAAALGAAAARPESVSSVVSRGGRPDLAPDLEGVRAPTLMLVGSRDPQVIDLNQQAAARLSAEHELYIVEGATHLFEEPGTLDIVAERAAAWFIRTMPARAH
ncbi:dienelactone hydrolase [Arthrobacter crystallopoietes BAB-32]|uniref:Dienelactone hydrolase n=1 Tax=Arthrobacter crystallopoietes BAB-32 TaxID=1246476 RepID=N1UPT1_9MICC|nr:alpha/beta family hydrolase [Arthrobacter crystallopoietes]EMY32396.1 dienelactone hydrolase [Arthrobacter crystallopoietes BAB-32]